MIRPHVAPALGFLALGDAHILRNAEVETEIWFKPIGHSPSSRWGQEIVVPHHTDRGAQPLIIRGLPRTLWNVNWELMYLGRISTVSRCRWECPRGYEVVARMPLIPDDVISELRCVIQVVWERYTNPFLLKALWVAFNRMLKYIPSLLSIICTSIRQEDNTFLSYFFIEKSRKKALQWWWKILVKTQVIHKYWRKSCLFLI